MAVVAASAEEAACTGWSDTMLHLRGALPTRSKPAGVLRGLDKVVVVAREDDDAAMLNTH